MSSNKDVDNKVQIYLINVNDKDHKPNETVCNLSGMFETIEQDINETFKEIQIPLNFDTEKYHKHFSNLDYNTNEQIDNVIYDKQTYENIPCYNVEEYSKEYEDLQYLHSHH
jgi:hypothetical protein